MTHPLAIPMPDLMTPQAVEAGIKFALDNGPVDMINDIRMQEWFRIMATLGIKGAALHLANAQAHA